LKKYKINIEIISEPKPIGSRYLMECLSDKNNDQTNFSTINLQKPCSACGGLM